KRVLDFPLPEYHELVADRMRRLVESAETAPPVEVRIQRLDGRVIDVEVLTVTTPYQGEPGFQLVIRDVTQERRNEQRQQRINAALCAVLIIADELMRCRDTEELLRRAVELARERLGLERCSLHLVDGTEMCGTFGTNLQGETTDEREHRYAGGDYWATIRQTLPGSPHWGVLNQPYREWTGDEMDTLAGTEGATVFSVVQAEDEPLGVFYNDYAISGRPVDPNVQEIVAIYCSLLGNILHRQRAEAALRESERRFREMTDLLPDTIFETELNGLLTYANRAAFDLTGYDGGDLERGMRLLDLLSDDQLEKARQCLEKLITTGETDTAQYYLRRADGTTVPVEVRTSARRGTEGAVIGFRGVVRDITERLRVEEAQRLASAGELAASMAHEFGNILAGMRAWAQVYQRTNSEDAWDNLISTVLRGSDRGGALCWNLLRLAHPSAPERQAINIESAIEAALSMAAPELEHHEVQVARNYETGSDGDQHAARVFADPAQMEQVFLN
ncbi:MAG: PAS domain S-box protein, partial [Armatimonadota bacterium]